MTAPVDERPQGDLLQALREITRRLETSERWQREADGLLREIVGRLPPPVATLSFPGPIPPSAAELYVRWDRDAKLRQFGLPSGDGEIAAVADLLQGFSANQFQHLLSHTLDLLCLQILFENQPITFADWLPSTWWMDGKPRAHTHWLWGFGVFPKWTYQDARTPKDPPRTFAQLVFQLNKAFKECFPNADKPFRRGSRQQYQLALSEGTFATDLDPIGDWAPVRTIVSLVRGATAVQPTDGGHILHKLASTDPHNIAALIWVCKCYQDGAKPKLTQACFKALLSAQRARVSELQRMVQVADAILTPTTINNPGFGIAPNSLLDYRDSASHLLECISIELRPRRAQPAAASGLSAREIERGASILRDLVSTCHKKSDVGCGACHDAQKTKCRSKLDALPSCLRDLRSPSMSMDELAECLLLFAEELLRGSFSANHGEDPKGAFERYLGERKLGGKRDPPPSRLSIDDKRPGTDEPWGEYLADRHADEEP